MPGVWPLGTVLGRVCCSITGHPSGGGSFGSSSAQEEEELIQSSRRMSLKNAIMSRRILFSRFTS